MEDRCEEKVWEIAHDSRHVCMAGTSWDAVIRIMRVLLVRRAFSHLIPTIALSVRLSAQ